VRDSSRKYLEDLISSMDLFDVKPSKGVFTWSNRRLVPGHIVAFCEEGTIYAQILPWASSDHKPISIAFLNKKNLGLVPLLFNPFCHDHLSFPLGVIG
jgi:hypothetical protein